MLVKARTAWWCDMAGTVLDRGELQTPRTSVKDVLRADVTFVQFIAHNLTPK